MSILNKIYNYLYVRRFEYLAIVGAFLIIFCTKQISANDSFINNYDLTAKSKASFLVSAKTVNFSINMRDYTFNINCCDKATCWNNDVFTPSIKGKTQVLQNVSAVNTQDFSDVAQFLINECK
jgi:hypothetical protein